MCFDALLTVTAHEYKKRLTSTFFYVPWLCKASTSYVLSSNVNVHQTDQCVNSSTVIDDLQCMDTSWTAVFTRLNYSLFFKSIYDFMPYVNTNSIPRYVRTIPVQSYSPHWNVIINQKWTVDMHLFHPRFLSLCCWDCIFPRSFRCHPTGRHSKLKKTCCWRCVNDLSSCLSLTVVQHRVFIITSFAIITGTSGTYLHKIISVLISSDRKLIYEYFLFFLFLFDLMLQFT